jgi:outer membrane protein TolC
MFIPYRIFYLFLMIIHRYLFITIFLGFCFTGSLDAQTAQTVREITVDEAVRIALDSNLSLRRSALDLQTRRRTADRSWNSLLPTINASAIASHPTSITGPIEPENFDVWTPGFSLSAGITFSTSVINNIKKAKADYEQGLLSYDAARQELELQVRKIFFQILLLNSNQELAAQNFESAQARYEQSTALVRIGQAPRLDELSARVDMENQRPNVRNAGMLYENALDTFKMILGLPSETVITLNGSLSGGIGNAFPTTGNSANASMEMSILQKSIQSMETQRNFIRNGAYIPSLRLSWSSAPMYSNSIQNERSWNDNGGSLSVSLGLNLDNFFP